MAEEFPGLDTLAKLQKQEAGALNTFPYNSNPICDFLMEKMLSCKYPMKRAYPYIFRICIDLLRNIATQEANAHQPLLADSVLNTASTHQLFNYIREYPFKKILSRNSVTCLTPAERNWHSNLNSISPSQSMTSCTPPE
ncbi:hypothetical protein FEF09_09055 [Chitinophaga pinensis]|uniref:Uncharacterized protein n=1 Tax=Chitinophaga pinensis TaxID=79329 RepID=A0A5C6LVU1_9BACT|nr:hypothetical protein FEF09_09055 [Chitinophaga pinensis]